MIVAYYSADRNTMIWVVNGCLEARITRLEAVEVSDYHQLLMERLTPLAFFCMPVHDEARR